MFLNRQVLFVAHYAHATAAGDNTLQRHRCNEDQQRQKIGFASKLSSNALFFCPLATSLTVNPSFNCKSIWVSTFSRNRSIISYAINLFPLPTILFKS